MNSWSPPLSARSCRPRTNDTERGTGGAMGLICDDTLIAERLADEIADGLEVRSESVSSTLGTFVDGGSRGGSSSLESCAILWFGCDDLMCRMTSCLDTNRTPQRLSKRNALGHRSNLQIQGGGHTDW